MSLRTIHRRLVSAIVGLGLVGAAAHRAPAGTGLGGKGQPSPADVYELKCGCAGDSGPIPVAVASDMETATRLFGESTAELLAAQLDFSRQQAVRVQWKTGGPPFGTLRYSMQNGKDGLRVTFGVVEPESAARRPMLQLRCSFFAVPKGAKVSFGG